MRRTFTLFLASLVSISVIAHAFGNHSPSGKNHNISELLLQKRLSNQRYSSDSKSQNALKSAQVIKQRLDSMVYKISDFRISQTINDSKSEYVYNSFGNVILEISYSWDITDNQWHNSYKIEYTYNDDGLKIKSLGFVWDLEMNQWVNTYLEEFTYNDQKMLSIQLSSSWNEDLNLWKLISQAEFQYDSNNNLKQKLNSNWDDDIKKLQTIGKTEYSYSDIGKINNEIYYVLKSFVWIQSGKYDYNYDANGNMFQEIEYYWYEITNQWLEVQKTDYFFDNSYSFSDLVLPIDFVESFFGHMITNGNSYGWDPVNNRWDDTNVDVFILSYSAVNVSTTTEIQNTGLTIYPNPAKDLVTFELKEFSEDVIIEFFDAKGNKVLAQQLPANKQISVNQLNSGMYFYKINQGHKILSGKIMIR
jgi:hypothetical protein